MAISVSRVEVARHAINPELTIDLNVTYIGESEIPFSFKGFIATRDGKRLATVDEYVLNGSERIMEGRVVGKNRTGSHREREQNLRVELNAQLTHKAIEHIENIRSQHHTKDVELYLNLVVKTLIIKVTPQDQIQALDDNLSVGLLVVRERNESTNMFIPQSDWIQKYTEPLGIGKFLLLELRLPHIEQPSDDWAEVTERLLKHVQQMESQIQQGDWYGVVVTSRRFAENLLSKKDLARREKFKQLFTENHYSDEGYNHLNKSIEEMFSYASKFIHDKDKNEQYHAIPIVKK